MCVLILKIFNIRNKFGACAFCSLRNIKTLSACIEAHERARCELEDEAEQQRVEGLGRGVERAEPRPRRLLGLEQDVAHEHVHVHGQRVLRAADAPRAEQGEDGDEEAEHGAEVAQDAPRHLQRCPEIREPGHAHLWRAEFIGTRSRCAT